MKHYEVVCAIILNGKNEVFCCQRGPGRALAFKFEFPGGKVEENETHEETIIREIKEELDTDITPIRFLCKSDYVYSKEDTGEFDPFSISLYAYLCRVKKGSLRLSEHVSSCFKNIKELKLLDFAKADIKIIKELENIEVAEFD